MVQRLIVIVYKVYRQFTTQCVYCILCPQSTKKELPKPQATLIIESEQSVPKIKKEIVQPVEQNALEKPTVKLGSLHKIREQITDCP